MQVDIPKGCSFESFLFRKVIIPKIFIPKGYYSEDFFITKGYYSEDFYPDQLIGHYSERF